MAFQKFIILVPLLISLVRSCEGVIELPKNMTVPAVFFFGDSIVDQGNNNNRIETLAKANFPPYGKDFSGGPTGRFSNGKTPADLIAGELGLAEIIPAYLDPNQTDHDLLTGVSFASGGSGYDNQTSLIAMALTMSDQLEQFKEYRVKLKAAVGEDRANSILNNSLYFVVAGSNDIATTYFTLPLRKLRYHDISSYVDYLVVLASDFIQELYNFGAKRVGVIGTPPLGCLPSQRTLGGGPERECAEDRNQASQLLNAKLSSALDSLKQNLTHSRLVYMDLYSPVMDLIQRPETYGFEVSVLGCCGTGKLEVIILCNKFSGTCVNDTKYVFWDSFHPTEQAYKVVVDSILTKYISSFL